MEQVRPIVDQEICTSCGTCVEACRFEVMKLRKRGAEACGVGTCLVCGQCVVTCPAGSVSHPLMPAERITELSEKPAVGYPELMDLLGRRRSIRRFTDEPVPEGVLRELVEAAILAPSGHNAQPWQFTFVTAADKLDAIRAAYAEYYRSVLDALADDNERAELARSAGERYVQIIEIMSGALNLIVRAHDRGEDRLLWGAPALAMVHSAPGAMAAESACTYAAANMLLAATALGYGTCLIGFLSIPLFADRSFMQVLGMPEDHTMQAAMVIGRPALRFRRMVVRRDPPVTII